uniref:Uncharacterized protein n=1 Tax=Strigamia maritima TaxID=126957 RepID=T1IMN6_STRMM
MNSQVGIEDGSSSSAANENENENENENPISTLTWAIEARGLQCKVIGLSQKQDFFLILFIALILMAFIGLYRGLILMAFIVGFVMGGTADKNENLSTVSSVLTSSAKPPIIVNPISDEFDDN